MYANDTAAWGAPCQHLNGTNCKEEGLIPGNTRCSQGDLQIHAFLPPRGIYAVPAQLHEKRHSTLVIRKVTAGKTYKSSSTLPTSKHDTDIHAMKVQNGHL